MIPEIDSCYVDGERQVHEIICLANFNSEPVIVVKSLKLGSLKQVITLDDFQNQFVRYIK